MSDSSAKSAPLYPKTSVYFALHALIVVYTFSSIAAKMAASYDFLSLGFVLCYGAMIAFMGIYALGWQQVIKRMPLTIAYANKAVTLIWNAIWGFLFFRERPSITSLIGVAIVLAGVILISQDDTSGTAPADDNTSAPATEEVQS